MANLDILRKVTSSFLCFAFAFPPHFTLDILEKIQYSVNENDSQ